jgi:hypothetical protein
VQGGLRGMPRVAVDRRRRWFEEGGAARRRGSTDGRGWHWPMVWPVTAEGEGGKDAVEVRLFSLSSSPSSPAGVATSLHLLLHIFDCADKKGTPGAVEK